HLLVGVALLGYPPGAALAQIEYREPPAPIGEILAAKGIPSVVVSPDRTWLLIQEPAGLAPIGTIATPWIPLAGYRINPRTNGPHPSYATYLSTFDGLRLRAVATETERVIRTPPGTRIRNVLWAPDSRTVAFTV